MRVNKEKVYGNLGSVGLGDSARIERVFADFVVGTSFDFGKSRHRTRKFIFNVMLHVGTLFAVLIALRKTWVPLVTQPF